MTEREALQNGLLALRAAAQGMRGIERACNEAGPHDPLTQLAPPGANDVGEQAEALERWIAAVERRQTALERETLVTAKRQRAVLALALFRDAAYDLADAWDADTRELLERGYPESLPALDEFLRELDAWQEAVKEAA